MVFSNSIVGADTMDPLAATLVNCFSGDGWTCPFLRSSLLDGVPNHLNEWMEPQEERTTCFRRGHKPTKHLQNVLTFENGNAILPNSETS